MRQKALKIVIFCLIGSLCLSVPAFSALDSDTASDYLVDYALKLYNTGDVDTAIHELNKALIADPSNARAREYLNLFKGAPLQPKIEASKPALISKPAPLTVEPLGPVALKAGRAKAFFDPKLKTCVDKETVFFAKNDDESVFERFFVKWDFADGTTASGREVKKVFAKPGIYPVKLILSDSFDKVVFVDQHRVYVYSPPVADAGDDQTVCLGKPVILDGSRSQTTNFIERCFNCELLSYNWDFGDGSPVEKGVRVKHTYKLPGTYKATLTIYDGKGRKCSVDKDSVIISVITRPALVLRKAGLLCVNQDAEFAVFFNATEAAFLDRNAFNYTWDFGDGAVKQGGPEITYAYAKSGEYLVTVTADDGKGTVCSRDTTTMPVKVNALPVADAGPNLVCCVNAKSLFDGGASFDPEGGKLTYFWDFGDGTTAKGMRVAHTYKKTGLYKVILTVEDDSGTSCNSSSSSFVANVSEKPVAIMEIEQ